MAKHEHETPSVFSVFVVGSLQCILFIFVCLVLESPFRQHFYLTICLHSFQRAKALLVLFLCYDTPFHFIHDLIWIDIVRETK